jgi:hypothetical protein
MIKKPLIHYESAAKFFKGGRGDSNAAITGKNPQISVRYFSNISIPMHKNNFLTAKM